MMRVQDVMTRGPKTVTPETTAEDAWNTMRIRKIHHLVVTDGSRAVGILSDRDTGGRHGASTRANRTVADLMTGAVVTVRPTMTVRAAANLMRGRSIGCLVVTDADRVVGIVTAADLLDLLGRGFDRPMPTTTRWTLKHRVPHRKQTRATGVW